MVKQSDKDHFTIATTTFFRQQTVANNKEEINNREDLVYAVPMQKVEPFTFDAQVADVFDNMITRSVPGYPLVLDLIGVIAEQFGQAKTTCYDLGCSLGAATLKLRQHLPADCHVIGVDNSTAMVERCRQNVARDHSQASVEIINNDIQQVDIRDASIVVMNFTLQFIPDEERIALLEKIAVGLRPGGVLVLSEKIHFDDDATQDFMTELHHGFKSHQGYSDLEIAQKRASLENVLISNTGQQHIDRMHHAGFERCQMILRCINFATFLGTK